MIVGPTKVKPRFLRALLRASASGVTAGTSARLFGRLTFVFPPTKAQRKASKLPNSRCTARKARAFFRAEKTFSRFRTMPGSWRTASSSASVMAATSAGSNP